MLSPEPEGASESGKKGGRGEKAPTSGEVSSQRIADARAVLAYYPEILNSMLTINPP